MAESLPTGDERVLHRRDRGIGSLLIAIGIILVASVSSCRTEPQESYTKARRDPPAEAYLLPVVEEGRDERSLRRAENARTYLHYEAFADIAKHSSTISLYEGLPHNLFEYEDYKAELAEKQTVEIDHEVFYAEKIALSDSDEKQLVDLFCKKTSFVPHRGAKGCGGFHADWCLVFQGQEDQIKVRFCFGCNEIRANDGENRLYCDIWNERPFVEVLQAYQQNRPSKKRSDAE